MKLDPHRLLAAVITVSYTAYLLWYYYPKGA